MKKAIALSSALLIAALLNFSANARVGPGPETITALIINADVTVVLLNNENPMKVVGDNDLTKLVTIKRVNDTMVINSTRSRNLKDAGIIFIPANQIRLIRINSEAEVRTYYALRIPRLEVVIAGACKLAIANIGELNLVNTECCEFEQATEIRHIPAGLIMNN